MPANVLYTKLCWWYPSKTQMTYHKIVKKNVFKYMLINITVHSLIVPATQNENDEISCLHMHDTLVLFRHSLTGIQFIAWVVEWYHIIIALGNITYKRWLKCDDKNTQLFLDTLD